MKKQIIRPGKKLSDNVVMVEALEYEFLKYFYQTADFGPADEDVRDGIKEGFKQDLGDGELPKGYELDGVE